MSLSCSLIAANSTVRFDPGLYIYAKTFRDPIDVVEVGDDLDTTRDPDIIKTNSPKPLRIFGSH